MKLLVSAMRQAARSVEAAELGIGLDDMEWLTGGG
jgi:hypothetical protein